MPFDYLHFLFEKYVFSSSVYLLNGLLVFLMLSCMSYLYMLNINHLLVMSFANIFSHSVGSLFVLLMVPFAVQKLLSLIRSHLFICSFVSFALGEGSKKNIATISVTECSAYVFLKEFYSICSYI